MQTRSSNGIPTTTVETHIITTTSAATTTSTTLGTTTTNARTGGSNPFPPSGTTFRPTATAICRPCIWVQRISEGGKVCPLEDTDSDDSNLHAPPSSIEEALENLGDDWRILHPFNLLGERHPTNATPLNQRRLAKNDPFVELIQTTEYLEDIPMWGKRDY